MSTEKKTNPPSERPESSPEDKGHNKHDELTQGDLDRVTGGKVYPLNPQPLPP
jgi:hypothetical protein